MQPASSSQCWSKFGPQLQRRNQGQHLLRATDSALGRVRAGTYGKCLSCGKQIDGRRLAAVPWTPYCIPCEEAFER
ncbi:MAG: TraR/DksA family transcriptional regulator [Candidatus Sulfotelmatobacter sp.]